MRNLLAYLWLIGITFLIVSCTSKFTVPYHHPLAVSAEDRVSRAPMGTVTMDLDHSGQDSDLKLLLTLSNSTAESIQVPLSAKDDCYRDAFWFYAKTEMGWHPMIPALSAKCLYSSPGEVIPSGLEKELDLGSIAGSRGLDIMGPGSYMLRVKYTDPRGQEFLLYTDEFHVGTPAPIDEFGITVEKVASNTLDWKVTNHSNRSVWLAPLCSSSRLAGGTIDEERSTLQRFTEAGSWTNLPVTCKQTPTAIKISPDETMVIDGRQWLENACLSLEPGQYRWDLVLFLQWLEGGQRNLAEGRHIFSKTFSIRN